MSQVVGIKTVCNILKIINNISAYKCHTSIGGVFIQLSLALLAIRAGLNIRSSSSSSSTYHMLACRPLLWLSTVLALRHPRSPPTGTQPTLPATLTPPTPTQSLSPLCLVLVPFMCIFLTVHHRYFSSSIWRDMLFYICCSVDTVFELINRICLMNYCSFLDLRSI